MKMLILFGIKLFLNPNPRLYHFRSHYPSRVFSVLSKSYWKELDYEHRADLRFSKLIE
jgi:hypothetical protein